MIHPAVRRRRQKRRMMAQAKNEPNQAQEITIKINLDKGTVSEETQQNQEGNPPEKQGWTWWQQLIGVELLIGIIIVFWYSIEYFYQLGMYNYFHITKYSMEITILKLFDPGYVLGI
jgi:hypothetical protein